MKLIHLAAVAALTLPLLASAQGRVVGAGTITCAKYTNSRSVFDKPTILMVTTWTQGYMTAMNLVRVNSQQPELKPVDQEQIETYTKKYCAEHPLNMTYQAAQALVNDLAPSH